VDQFSHNWRAQVEAAYIFRVLARYLERRISARR
jgi:hypothetical protein